MPASYLVLHSFPMSLEKRARIKLVKYKKGCSKSIAYFYLDTSNFKLAKKCSFHVTEVLPVARNAKLQPMYRLPEGVRVR